MKCGDICHRNSDQVIKDDKDLTKIFKDTNIKAIIILKYVFDN